MKLVGFRQPAGATWGVAVGDTEVHRALPGDVPAELLDCIARCMAAPGAVGLHIASRLNGQVMQGANTSDMVFGVAQTVSLLSRCLTLETSDVVVMGTPAGVGCARTPPVWMKAGDTIEIEIERVGTLRNPVTA